jgi:RND family efflux transporter MFP subunit
METSHHTTPPATDPAAGATHGETAAHHKHHQAHPPRPQGSRFTWLFACIAVAVLLAMGVMPRLHQAQHLKVLTAEASTDVVPVNVALPTVETGSTDVPLPGNVQAFDQTTISARTSGYVRKYYADIGYRVRAGQILADIEAPEVDQQLLQAGAENTRMAANGQQARADVAKMQANVYQADAVVARDRSAIATARAAVTHAHAKVLAAQSAASEARAMQAAAQRKLSSQRANLARVNTRLGLAKTTYTRWQQLAKGGAISGQDLDESQAEYESAQSTVEGAKSDVETAQADVDAAGAAVQSREGDIAAARADEQAAQQQVQAAIADQQAAQAAVNSARASVQASAAGVSAADAAQEATRADYNRVSAMKGFQHVVAPYNGVITARNIDVGSLVNAGSSPNVTADPTATVPHTGLFGIARTDELRIQVNVPEDVVSDVKIGQTARVTVQEIPGQTFTGRVFNTSGALDAASRTMLVEIRVQNPDNKLVPGMFAQVHFQVHRAHPVIRIPANALIIDALGTRVAVVGEGDKIHMQPVTPGRDQGSTVEIRSGLSEHDRIVTDPTDQLTEGTKVRVVSNSGN